MTNIWADSFSAIREISLNEKKEKEEKEEKGEKKHKEGPKEEKKEKETEGEAKRWWDDDGDGIGYEKGEVSGNFKKKVKKEERDLHSKSDKNDKIDVRKGIHNKINTKPTVSEDLHPNIKKIDAINAQRAKERAEKSKKERESNTSAFQAHKKEVLAKGGRPVDALDSWQKKKLNREEIEEWIQELLSEGYDLSEFTLDEIVDIYESVELDEADTYGMPAKGDAERQKADPMSAAKAKAARAKVAKERADFQVAQQAQRMKVSTTEAVLSFVEGRTPLFEARFDPKKSKLRPASERTTRVMTDADRKAAKKEAERTAEIHSKGETVLAGLRQGKRGKVQTTPSAKPAAPEANRKVKGKQDKLASAADKVLKGLKK